ncbi:MAG: hypothetical protein PVG73_11900 [Desulfobacterales bacterium]
MDARQKATGEARYSGDIRLPGMRYAAILRPTAHDAILKNLDLASAKKIKGVKILDENFDTYELSRFSWLPKIETVLVENPAMPPQGCGEPAITPMGAVIANAVFDAINVRLYELPMTPTRIKKAIKNINRRCCRLLGLSIRVVSYSTS